MTHLVLSLFPGIGLLDRAFEEEGFCVVRGPDLLWGGDIRSFHPPAGVFSGVIGGPPCQAFSELAKLIRANGHQPRYGNLIPEFERCVREAQPCWFLMENVSAAPLPAIEGYSVHSQMLNNRWLGEDQNRERRISFGTLDGRKLHIQYAALESPLFVETLVSGNGKTPGQRTRLRAKAIAAVTSSDGSASVRMARYSIAESARYQGLPEDFLSDAPFTADGKRRVIANGVPLPMGRAVAKAVKDALAP